MAEMKRLAPLLAFLAVWIVVPAGAAAMGTAAQ
jgi:hypothetical protein